MIARPENLLRWHLENFEEHLDQVWPVEVMEVLLAEVSFVAGLNSADN